MLLLTTKVRKPYLIPVSAVLLLAFASETMAFWRMGCRSRTGLVRIDPLVSPGQVSEHIHAIHGSSGFSETATYDELMAGHCTSCEVVEDKSAYWHPALYFRDAETGKFSLVPQVGGMLAYYLLNPNPGQNSITSFPAGFQMIAGDTNQRNFTYPVPDIEKSQWNQEPYNTQAFLRQAALGFNCLNYNIAPEPSLYRHFLPDKAYLDQNCPQGVRFELMFPSCWNGQKEIPKNKIDHMVYPNLVMSGGCPEGFPVRLPSLFYEIIWDTYAFKDNRGDFVLANGDPTGFGFHGDFIMGWDEDLLQRAVNTCTNLSGKVSDCPLFTLQDLSAMETCNLTSVPAAVVQESNQIHDLQQLPGSVPVQPGPAYAHGEGSVKETLPEMEPEPPVSPPTMPDKAVPAKVKLDESPPADPLITPGPDPNIEQPLPDDGHYSTEYKTVDNQVIKIIWVQESVTKTVIAYEPETATVMGHQKRSHMHKHRRQFQQIGFK